MEEDVDDDDDDDDDDELVFVGDRGSSVVKVLCYKSEGRWFDSRWFHWNFPLT